LNVDGKGKDKPCPAKKKTQKKKNNIEKNLHTRTTEKKMGCETEKTNIKRKAKGVSTKRQQKLKKRTGGGVCSLRRFYGGVVTKYNFFKPVP